MLLINFKSSAIIFQLMINKYTFHSSASSTHKGRGAGVNRGGGSSYDLPLIIRHCQSLHNTKNSAPSHVEHPRSLSSSLSTHGLMCLYSTESKQWWLTKFILEVQILPSGPPKLHPSAFNSDYFP